MTPNSPATRRRGPRGCPASRCAPPGRRWRPGPCCSRCRGAATWRRSPASAAAPGSAAARVPVRSRSAVPRQQLRCGWCGAPAGQTCAACGGHRPARPGHRRAADRRGAGPGVSRRHRADLERRRAWSPRCPAAPAIVIATPGAEPRARRRLRGGDPARWLGAARQAEPAGGRGGAAALDERRRAGQASGRRAGG